MEISTILLSIHFIALAIYLISIITCYFSYFGTPLYNDFVIKVLKNWNNSPILEIKELNFTCQDSNILSFDTWPGTSVGCLSLGIVRNTGSCTKYDSKLNAIKEVPYIYWNSKLFCVKKLGNNYLDGLNLVPNNTACPQNFKNCGKIDTLDNILCISINDSCPINKILFTDSNKYNITDNYTYSTINLNDERKLLFTNQNIINKALTGFKISENIPCSTPKFDNQVYKKYPLDYYIDKDKCLNPIYGSLTDLNYVYLDSFNYKSLLTENLIIYSIQKLPQISNYDFDHKTNLYGHYGYIGINSNCYQTISNQKLSVPLMDSLKFLANYSPNYDIIYIGIIILGPSTIFYFFYMIFIFSLFWKLNSGRLCTVENRLCLNAGASILIISLLLSTAFLILYCFYLNEVMQAINNYNIFSPYMKCGDPEYNKEFSKLNVYEIFTYCLITIILIIITIILRIYFLIKIIYYNCCEKIENSENNKKIESFGEGVEISQKS